jgi:hypothetical protein
LFEKDNVMNSIKRNKKESLKKIKFDGLKFVCSLAKWACKLVYGAYKLCGLQTPKLHHFGDIGLE